MKDVVLTLTTFAHTKVISRYRTIPGFCSDLTMEKHENPKTDIYTMQVISKFHNFVSRNILLYRYTVDANYVRGGGFCWYAFSNLNRDIGGVSLSDFSLTNSHAEIYRLVNSTHFVFLGNITENGDSKFIKMPYNDNIYVLVIANSEESGKFVFTSKAESIQTLSITAVIFLILGSLAILIALGFLISYFVKKHKKQQDIKYAQERICLNQKNSSALNSTNRDTDKSEDHGRLLDETY